MMQSLIRRWEEAERRLYPSMVAQPELVARSLGLVRAVADELLAVETVEGLAEAWGRATEIAEAAARREGGAEDEDVPDLELIAGAAFALRHRELVAEAGRREARRRIAEARARGEAWVVVDEAGVAEAPFPQPYRRVEMRLADGLGVYAFAELDPDTMEPAYGLELLRLDPETGEVADRAEEGPRTYPDIEAWRRAAREAKRGEPS